ncbi:MAG: tetratricopeptide repeat protein [Acidobacteriota bacterium]|nr:tetratricopeptide repeat protein [Acidobacteriota bacterium]
MSQLLEFSVFIAFISLSVTSWAQNFIRGVVHYPGGNPADHVIVRLRSDKVAFQSETQTDMQGKFTFDGLPLTTFHLTIEGQGFRPYSSAIDITMSKMSYEQITIRPDREPDAKAVPNEGPAGELNARIAQIPTKARKEFEAGKQKMQTQNGDGSIQHFQKAIALDPNYAEAYQLLGVLEMEGGKIREAEPHLQKAVEIEPNMSTAHFALGICLNMLGRYPEAEATLIKGLELDPGSAEGHNEIGKTYWALGRWQEAEPHALKAAALKPDMAQAHVLLGDIALRKKNAQDALKEYKEAIRLDPKGPMTPPVQQMVKKIEDAMQQPR